MFCTLATFWSGLLKKNGTSRKGTKRERVIKISCKLYLAASIKVWLIQLKTFYSKIIFIIYLVTPLTLPVFVTTSNLIDYIFLSLCRPHPSVVYGAFYDREAKSKSLHLWQRQRSLSRKPKGDLLSAALAHSKVPTRAVGTGGNGRGHLPYQICSYQ